MPMWTDESTGVPLATAIVATNSCQVRWLTYAMIGWLIKPWTSALVVHNIGLDWIEQCFTSLPTQYRLYGRRFLQVKKPNQQYQSTEGGSCKEKNQKNKENRNYTCIHTQNSRQIQHTRIVHNIPQSFALQLKIDPGGSCWSTILVGS